MQQTQKARFIPQQRYDWVQYVENDAPEGTIPFEAKVRSSLTPPEINSLVWDNDDPLELVWQKFAPYVVEWNLSGLDADGNIVDIPSPAEGGGEQFQHVPVGIFWELVRDIKIRSNRPLDPKRNALSGPTPVPLNGQNSNSET